MKLSKTNLLICQSAKCGMLYAKYQMPNEGYIMENDFIFELGRFTFLYSVCVEPQYRFCLAFDLDLIEVFFDQEPLTDDEMEVIDCEHIYDWAYAEFKKQRL